VVAADDVLRGQINQVKVNRLLGFIGVGADEQVSGLKGGGGGIVQSGHLDTSCLDACLMLYSVSMHACAVHIIHVVKVFRLCEMKDSNAFLSCVN